MKREFAIAVKGVIVREDRALVLHRSKKEMESSYMNRHQKWDLPGGGLHFSERTEVGLLREVFEETGLQVEVGEPISVFDVIRGQIHLCILTYICFWKQGEVQLSEEHEAFFWMTKEDIRNSKMPFWMKRDLFRGLEKE